MIYPAQFEETKGNDVWCDEEGNETYVEFSDGFVVTFRDVPEAITQGDTFLEAVEMAQDCLSLVLFGYEEDGEQQPQPSAPRHGDVMIEVTL